MPIQPYLMFNGRCEEAIDFYKKALGAQAQMVLRFKEAPDQSMITPGMDEKIDRPPLKWSTLSYGFALEEDRNAEEDVQAGRDCRQAAAG